MTLSAQTGYFMPWEYEVYIVWGKEATYIDRNKRKCKKIRTFSSAWALWR